MESMKEWATVIGTLGLGTALTIVAVISMIRAARHIDRAYLRPLVIAHLELVHELKRFMAKTDARLQNLEERTAHISKAVGVRKPANADNGKKKPRR